MTKAGSGSGTVAGTGVDCGTDCTELYPEGTVLDLQAIPDTGSVFVEWQINQTPVSGMIGVEHDVTMTAVFDLE